MATQYIQRTIALFLFTISISCSASNRPADESAKALVHDHLSISYSVGLSKESFFVKGDFNADGNQDIAVLFLPDLAPIQSSKIQIDFPWIYPNIPQAKGALRTSLAVFHGTGDDSFRSINLPVYCLLDRSGVLETPSFSLLVSNRSDESYASHAGMFVDAPKGDLIILPTEAGIDTYIYWNGTGYSLFEPEEMP